MMVGSRRDHHFATQGGHGILEPLTMIPDTRAVATLKEAYQVVDPAACRQP
jgi:hypothetical protein